MVCSSTESLLLTTNQAQGLVGTSNTTLVTHYRSHSCRSIELGTVGREYTFYCIVFRPDEKLPEVHSMLWIPRISNSAHSLRAKGSIEKLHSCDWRERKRLSGMVEH